MSSARHEVRKEQGRIYVRGKTEKSITPIDGQGSKQIQTKGAVQYKARALPFPALTTNYT
jgi:hypothetical protein